METRCRMNGSGFAKTGMGLRDFMSAGYGVNPATNETAMDGYGRLTEAEKEQLLMQCRDARTEDEMKRVVDSMVPGTDVQAVVEEEKLV